MSLSKREREREREIREERQVSRCAREGEERRERMESQLRFLNVSFNVNYLDRLVSRLCDGVMQVLKTTERILQIFICLRTVRRERGKREKHAHMASDVS